MKSGCLINWSNCLFKFYACAYHILKYNLVIKQIKVSYEKFSTMQYYLKARFHFNKNQFADLMLIAGIISTISQVCFIDAWYISHTTRFLIFVLFLYASESCSCFSCPYWFLP